MNLGASLGNFRELNSNLLLEKIKYVMDNRNIFIHNQLNIFDGKQKKRVINIIKELAYA
jgi:hypothetical protein